MMTIAFSGLKPEQAFIYMDGLTVIEFSENQHIGNLESTQFIWTKQGDDSFNLLKTSLTSVPILTYSDFP